MSATLKAPDGFTAISTNSSISNPFSDSIGTANRQSVLIILCTWMAASPKNVAKYADKYRETYPAATILLIQSAIWDMTWRPVATQRKNMVPAVRILHDFLASSTSDPSVVLHIFSHGGTNSALQLLQGYRARAAAPVAIHLKAFVLDSTPGDDSYSRAIAAVSQGLPRSGPLRWMAIALAHLTLVTLITLGYLRLTRRVEDMRADLLDPQLFSTHTPRLYCFSKADAMVDWRAVAKHAVEAEQAGYRVRSELFSGSPHCGHILEDGGRYWGAIADTIPLNR